MVRLVNLICRGHSNERLMSRVKLADIPLKYRAPMDDDYGQVFIGLIKIIILICLNQILTRMRAVLIFSGIC